MLEELRLREPPSLQVLASPVDQCYTGIWAGSENTSSMMLLPSDPRVTGLGDLPQAKVKYVYVVVILNKYVYVVVILTNVFRSGSRQQRSLSLGLLH